MNWTLEVLSVPVRDVERAKAFYADKLGFQVDFDFGNEDYRCVQLTPPGSGCSIAIGTNMRRWRSDASGRFEEMRPGTLTGMQLVVRDLVAARADLVARGVDVTEIHVHDKDGFRPCGVGDNLDNAGFLFLTDPDGNAWTIQQISART